MGRGTRPSGTVASGLNPRRRYAPTTDGAAQKRRERQEQEDDERHWLAAQDQWLEQCQQMIGCASACSSILERARSDRAFIPVWIALGDFEQEALTRGYEPGDLGPIVVELGFERIAELAVEEAMAIIGRLCDAIASQVVAPSGIPMGEL